MAVEISFVLVTKSRRHSGPGASFCHVQPIATDELLLLFLSNKTIWTSDLQFCFKYQIIYEVARTLQDLQPIKFYGKNRILYLKVHQCRF